MNSLKYLPVILESDYKNWSVLFQKFDEILEEVDEILLIKGILSTEIKNRIFWFFRNYFGSDENSLSDEQAKKLYNILFIVLQKDACLLNLYHNDLSILEDMLIVFERIFYFYPELKGDMSIFNPLIKSATYKKELNTTKNVDGFINALLHCYKACFPVEKITNSIELIHLTQVLQEFFDKQLVWNKNDPVALLVHGLLFLKDLRINYKENAEIYFVIDHYAAKMCDIAIRDIPKAYPYYSINLIQEDIGAAYVKCLKKEYRNCFDGIYKILSPEDILPKVYIHPLVGDINFPNTNIRINYDELSFKKNNYMKHLINELHKQLKNFLSSIKIKFLNLNEINIQLNLFNDQKQFERYGYLVWNVDSSGGGICIPGMNNKPTKAFVYQTDQGFENLTHELSHAFMNNIFGSYYTMYLSGAFVEGLADFFDKGPDNFNKLIQMQRLLVKEPIKTLPEIVKLNEGGSIVYLYGYFLIGYFIEEKLLLLSEILFAVQIKNQYYVNQLIEQFGLEQQESFGKWLQTKLSRLSILLFEAIHQQNRGNVNQLLAGINEQLINMQDNSKRNTPLHVAIEIWIHLKNDVDDTKKIIALSIIWALLLKGAELKNIRNINNKSAFDLIEEVADRELIERYARDAKHYIDLGSNSYIKKTSENTIAC